MDKFQLGCLTDHDLSNLWRDTVAEQKKRACTIKTGNRLCTIGRKTSKTFNTLELLNESISQKNASGIFYLPHHKKKDYPRLSIYLPSLIRQDWSRLYSGGDTEQKYYVYAHVDPREPLFVTAACAGGTYGGTPFYIGKGTGNRAYDLKRNQGHGKLIRDICSNGYDGNTIVKIISNDLTEAAAYELEAKLIYFFGTTYQNTKNKGCLVNLDVPSTPEFNGQMKIMRGIVEWNNEKAQQVRDVLKEEAQAQLENSDIAAHIKTPVPSTAPGTAKKAHEVPSENLTGQYAVMRQDNNQTAMKFNRLHPTLEGATAEANRLALERSDKHLFLVVHIIATVAVEAEEIKDFV